MTETPLVPTPYRELVTQVGQQRIVDALSEAVLRGDLEAYAAKEVIEHDNWEGALVLLRAVNAKRQARTA